jgi:hypothetical protein
MEHGGIAETLRAHAAMARANLLVMGAYAHPRMLEIVIGSVTTTCLPRRSFQFFFPTEWLGQGVRSYRDRFQGERRMPKVWSGPS